MSAITAWFDESEIKHEGKTIWIIGQLITKSDLPELDFFKKLRDAHRQARTWDTLHANEFTKAASREWDLLNRWVDIFLEDQSCSFHAFVFEESAWKSRFPSPHHYFAHQICFGLGNKMKSSGLLINKMFSSVDLLTIIMDRRATSTGFIQREEGGNITIDRINRLEDVYENQIKNTLLKQSGKVPERLGLRFSFANSKCFEALQLCDALTYMVRKRFLFENGITDDRPNDGFLDLWNIKFLEPGKITELKNFSYSEKFNYFRAER